MGCLEVAEKQSTVVELKEEAVPQIKFEVNGKAVTVDVAPNTLLVDVLRESIATHRHTCRLRHQPVRGLRGACRTARR